MKNKYFAIIYLILFIILLTIKIYLHTEFNQYLIINIVVDILSLVISYLMVRNIKNDSPKYNNYYFYQLLSATLLFLFSSLVGILILYNYNLIMLYILLLVIIYGVSIAIYLFFGKTKDIVKEINDNKNDKVSKWREYLIVLENVDEKIKEDKNYNKLLELYKYSDPINEKLMELDEEIFKDIDNLDKEFNNDSLSNLMKKIKIRNEKVKLNK